MEKINLSEVKLTVLQEKVLSELEKTTNQQFICKKLNIKPISLSKSISSLESKDLVCENNITEKGKKMAHYLSFKNETISLFLKKYKIEESQEIIKQISALDYRIIIALRNLVD